MTCLPGYCLSTACFICTDFALDHREGRRQFTGEGERIYKEVGAGGAGQASGTPIIVPEPQRLLEQWAEKYKERYRWRLRSSFQIGNSFGTRLEALAEGIGAVVDVPYTFTSTVATIADAPFIDVDLVEVFVLDAGQKTARLRDLKPQGGNEPPIRAISLYDAGVFMYTRKIETALVVSPVQVYLDLYARGGRDLKQAEYLLNNVIQPKWGKS